MHPMSSHLADQDANIPLEQASLSNKLAPLHGNDLPLLLSLPSLPLPS